MIPGRERGIPMNMPSGRGKVTIYGADCVIVIIMPYTLHYSYLKDLIPSFNECVDQFLERLRPLADGRTQVPMKEELATLTLSIISKVNRSPTQTFSIR